MQCGPSAATTTVQQVGSAPYLTHIIGPRVHGRRVATEQTGAIQRRVGVDQRWLMMMTHVFNQHLRHLMVVVVLAAADGHQLGHCDQCDAAARVDRGLSEQIDRARRWRLADDALHRAAEVTERCGRRIGTTFARRGRGRRVGHRRRIAGDAANRFMRHLAPLRIQHSIMYTTRYQTNLKKS